MKTSIQEEKSQLMAYCLWGLGIVGINGMHSLYLGQYKRGTLLLVTFGGLGILQVIDLFSLALEVKKFNGDEELNIRSRHNEIDYPNNPDKKDSNKVPLEDSLLNQLETEQVELEQRLKKFKD
ncbi:TM2 domain-containing protein [Synechococcus sp. AH-603-L18]|nr:TM2 domain-containing protein [Synechococcus sp. AH-603-L18]MDB4337894.1 TM2 domain-containing protein [Synechococcus sp. AH-603-L18]